MPILRTPQHVSLHVSRSKKTLNESKEIDKKIKLNNCVGLTIFSAMLKQYLSTTANERGKLSRDHFFSAF